MNIRFVFVLVFVLFCVMGVVYGGSNTTNINNTSDNVMVHYKDAYGVVYALEDGHFNTSFTGGFNGYCLEYGEIEAVKGDSFVIGDSKYMRNTVTGEECGDYLKVYFIDYYSTAMKDKIVTQHMIWHFTDDFNGWRLNYTLIDCIKDKVDNQGLSYDDVGYKFLDDGRVLFWEFYTFLSSYINHQDYFGYKVWFGNASDIPVNNTTNNTTNNVDILNNTPMNNTDFTGNYTDSISDYNYKLINNYKKPLNNYTTGWNVWLLTCVIIMVLIIFIVDRRDRK